MTDSDVDAHPPGSVPDESVAELVGDLATEVSTLVRQELALAAREMSKKAHDAGHGAVLVGVGALLGAVSLLVLTAALVLALGSALPMWIAALVISVAIGATGCVLFRAGTARLRGLVLAPTETFASVAEDGALVKHQIAATRVQVVATMDEIRHRLEASPKPRKRRAPAKRKPAT